MSRLEVVVYEVGTRKIVSRHGWGNNKAVSRAQQTVREGEGLAVGIAQTLINAIGQPICAGLFNAASGEEVTSVS